MGETPSEFYFNSDMAFLHFRLKQDTRSSHALRIRLLGPDNEQVLETDEMRTPPQEVSPPFEYGHIQLTVGLMNVVMLEEGRFRVQLIYDGEQVKETRLWVKSAVSPGQQELPGQVAPEGDSN
jgi:hypothetical protein